MDFFQLLREIFPNHSSQIINETIEYVESDEGDGDPDDFKLERMTSLLLEKEEGSTDDDDEDEAFGYQSNSEQSTLLKQLLDVYPDANPKYVERIIDSKDLDLVAWINYLATNGYEKKQSSSIDVLHSRLVEMLPKVDPSYLRNEAATLVHKSEGTVMEYVNNMLDRTDYPTIEDYNKREAETNARMKYTDNFMIEDFLNEIPDPFKYFQNKDRQHSLVPKNPPDETLEGQIEYALVVLHNYFSFLQSNDIKMHMNHYKNDVVKVSEKLERLPRAFKKGRPKQPLPACNFTNKLLLQELAFVQHRTNIRRYMKLKNQAYMKAYTEAKKANLLETCGCCFNDELLPEECYFCMKNCIFCKDCVKTGAETVIGNGNLEFPCFNNCTGQFSMMMLQMVLDTNVFTRLAQRKQIEDLRKADLNDFLTCTFCNDYLAQQDPRNRIFVCKNNNCLKETCLDCGHESHIPKRCSEIEYDEDVQRRTYIENKMTEALVRTCQKCDKKIIKESGCNKMTCNCGTTMCYVCGRSGIDYSHFGLLPKCALHLDQTELHTNNVLQGIQAAKRDLGVDLNPALLKFDPAKNFNMV